MRTSVKVPKVTARQPDNRCTGPEFMLIFNPDDDAILTNGLVPQRAVLTPVEEDSAQYATTPYGRGNAEAMSFSTQHGVHSTLLSRCDAKSFVAQVLLKKWQC
nr:hypothetical protein B0A51_05945 [Rachicladosporium sp. CCFEE 5018]